MDNDDREVAFHASLEPDVIINDGSGDNCVQQKIYNKRRTVIPDVSIIPFKKKHSFKIKFMDNNGAMMKEEHKVKRTIQRSPRQAIRIVSREEILRAQSTNTNLKRKSLPLEKCPICKKYFRRMKTHLQKHEDIKRNPNDPLACQFCTKMFNTGSNLSIHMRTHTGDKPYRCDVCSKGFAQSCNLINHMRIHTGERPFKCPHCERAFTQSGNLSNHIRLHTDEKPFKCHFCDKAFTQSGNLNSHIRNNHKFLGLDSVSTRTAVMNNTQ